jgi:hypothetical protein
MFKNSAEFIANLLNSINSNDSGFNEVRYIFNSYVLEIDKIIEDRKNMDIPFNN